jgi:hypothetical protein
LAYEATLATFQPHPTQRVAHGDHGNEGTALSHDQAPEKYATRAAVLPVISTACHRQMRALRGRVHSA